MTAQSGISRRQSMIQDLNKIKKSTLKRRGTIAVGLNKHTTMLVQDMHELDIKRKHDEIMKNQSNKSI